MTLFNLTMSQIQIKIFIGHINEHTKGENHNVFVIWSQMFRHNKQQENMARNEKIQSVEMCRNDR